MTGTAFEILHNSILQRVVFLIYTQLFTLIQQVRRLPA